LGSEAPEEQRKKCLLDVKSKYILLILELRNVITNPRQQFIKSRKTANQKNVSQWEDVVGKFCTRSTRCCTWHVHFLNMSSYEVNRESTSCSRSNIHITIPQLIYGELYDVNPSATSHPHPRTSHAAEWGAGSFDG